MSNDEESVHQSVTNLYRLHRQPILPPKAPLTQAPPQNSVCIYKPPALPTLSLPAHSHHFLVHTARSQLLVSASSKITSVHTTEHLWKPGIILQAHRSISSVPFLQPLFLPFPLQAYLLFWNSLQDAPPEKQAPFAKGQTAAHQVALRQAAPPGTNYFASWVCGMHYSTFFINCWNKCNLNYRKKSIHEKLLIEHCPRAAQWSLN